MIAPSLINITETLSTAIKELDPDALIGGIREGIHDALSETLSHEEPEEAVVQAIVNEVCNKVSTLFQKRHKDVNTAVLIETLRKCVTDIMGGEDYEDDEKWVGLQVVLEDAFAQLSLREVLLGTSETENKMSRRRGKARNNDTIEENSSPARTPAQKKTHENPSGPLTGDPILARLLRDIAKTPLLTREEEGVLAIRIKEGDEKARAHMIEANLRLVVHIAKDYSNYGLSFLDLIQEGSMGLTKAVDRYDPSYGSKLSTYAAWWIKQSIRRALSHQSKTIRIPVHMVSKISKMRRVAMVLSEELGRDPTDEELAEEIGIERIKIKNMKAAALSPMSLNAPMSNDDTTEFGEIIADENARSPSEITIEKNMHNQVGGFLLTLNKRERVVIEGRFGLNGKKKSTLENIGKEFGVTRERIRLIERKALRKLRGRSNQDDNPFREEKGHDFIGESLDRTRALEQLARMQKRMHEKALVLSEFGKQSSIHPPDTSPHYNGLRKGIRQKIADRLDQQKEEAKAKQEEISEQEKQRRREEREASKQEKAQSEQQRKEEAKAIMKKQKEEAKAKQEEIAEQGRQRRREEKEELTRQREEDKRAEKEEKREEKSQQEIEAQLIKQQAKEEERGLKSAAKKRRKTEKEALKQQRIHAEKQRRKAETARSILEKWTKTSPTRVASPKILKDINMRGLISLQLLNKDEADFDSLVTSIADTMGEDIDVISATILDIRKKS